MLANLCEGFADTSPIDSLPWELWMKIEDRYTFGAALFMVLTSVAYLYLAGR